MNYQVPAQDACVEQIIQKSRFITHISRAKNKAQAVAFITTIKAQYPDARHHCWAYIAGHPTNSTAIASSNDGEPQGTAGKPILNVLQHRGVGEIVLVVVRYFGGIKLGAGGLVRAYSSSAHLAMETLQTQTLMACKSFEITFDYALETPVKHVLGEHKILILQASYRQKICLLIEVAEQGIQDLNDALINTTSGKVCL